MDCAKVADVSAVPERGSYLFTVEDPFANEEEVILVRCAEDPGIEAWINRCPHQNQRFDTGRGAPMRDGAIVCPRHGSLFDTCSGECDNGEAAGTELPAVDIAVRDDAVFLTDREYTYSHDGGTSDDDGSGSTSHISF